MDLIFNGHVHAYERSHPVYKYQPDTCGPMYVVIGDGGNVEGLNRDYVDNINNSTNLTLCMVRSVEAAGQRTTAAPLR